LNVGSCGSVHIVCLKIERTLGVFEDRFGWPELPFAVAGVSRSRGWRFQDRFGWPCCPLLLPEEDGVLRTVVVGQVALCCCDDPSSFTESNLTVPSLRDVKYSQSSKQDRKLIVVCSACCRLVMNGDTVVYELFDAK